MRLINWQLFLKCIWIKYICHKDVIISVSSHSWKSRLFDTPTLTTTALLPMTETARLSCWSPCSHNTHREAHGALPQATAATAWLLAITHIQIRHSSSWRALLLTYNIEKAVRLNLVSSLLPQLSWYSGNSLCLLRKDLKQEQNQWSLHFAQAGIQVILLLCLTWDYQKLLQTAVSIENHLSIVLDTFPLLPWRAWSNYILVTACKRERERAGDRLQAETRGCHGCGVYGTGCSWELVRGLSLP